MIPADSNLPESIRFLASSILIHELLGISNWGTDYLSRCVAPVFGLRLGPFSHSLIHILLIAVTAWLCLTADPRFLTPLFILLTLTIASYSIRLSNHLVVSWFLILVLMLDFLMHDDLAGMSELGVRGIVMLTYAFAGFHKLNRDYLSPSSSCAVRLVYFYFQGRLESLWFKRFILFGVVWAPIILEAAIPMLLLFNQTRLVGVLVALILQSLFGFARNAHFSIVMYAGLIVFLPPPSLSPAILFIGCALGILVAYRFCMWKVYPLQKLALVVHAVFGVVTVYMFIWTTVAAATDLHVSRPENVNWLVIAVLFSLFALNAASPFYSSKTEFSLAMFSNVRPDRRSHLAFRQAQGHSLGADEYVQIVKMHGMPELSDCARLSMGYRLVRSFIPYEKRKYLKYYLVESLRNLQNQLAPDFYLELTDGSQDFGITSITELSELKHRKICFTPAFIPRDPKAPYCN
jgi:hypothetical protein